MAQHVKHPATSSTTARPQLARARLLLGAATAAAGLFVALHWIGPPGAQLFLNHNRQGTDSVNLLEQAAPSASHRKTSADRAARVGQSARRRNAKARKGSAAKTAPRAAGKRIPPTTKQPGRPGAASPPTSGGNDSSSSSPPPAGKNVLPTPPPSPPSPLPPVDVPQLPEVPQLPQVPQVPVPSVPAVPTPQLPSLPTPKVPKLP